MATCPACRKRYPDNVTTCEVDGETLLPNEAFTGVDVELSSGHAVGEYRIEGKLGEGGFGCVYKAVHPLIGKAAAIKVLNRQYSSNPQMVSRFIAEARAVNQIRHRNIIDIFAFGALEDGRQYFIMELLEGLPLDKFLERKGQLTVEEAVAVLRPVARALDAAHAAGIAHRDLKPENIFLAFDDDGAPFPKLLDFGIAKLLTPDASGARSAKTRTGTPMGTPFYMSPEQCRGKNVDHRTDIYSFGILLHQVLTGKLPFDGEDVMDLLIKQSTAPAPPISTVATNLPAAIDAPILKMLEKDPAQRPASLGAAMDGFITAAQSAGFAVTLGGGSVLRSVLSQSGPTPQIGLQATPSDMRGQLTPEQLKSIAEGKTMTKPAPMQTFQGANLDVAPAPRRRTALFVLAPIALLAGLGIGLVALKRTPPPTRDPVKTAEPPVSAPPPAASPAPAASASVPAPPEDVLVTVRATPEHASIWLGTERVGVAPGPVKIKRGDAKVKLTLKADGYAPYDVEVEPVENTIVTAKLAKSGGGRLPPKQPSSSSSGEIENPFK